MCNACGNLCCGSDEFDSCGCDHCSEPDCWSRCMFCEEQGCDGDCQSDDLMEGVDD